MNRLLWRWTEHRIERHVPPARRRAILGDLAEDYADQRASHGRARAALWLVRETRSVSRAYARDARDPGRSRISVRDALTRAWRALRIKPGIPLLSAALLAVAIGLGVQLVTKPADLYSIRIDVGEPAKDETP